MRRAMLAKKKDEAEDQRQHDHHGDHGDDRVERVACFALEHEQVVDELGHLRVGRHRFDGMRIGRGHRCVGAVAIAPRLRHVDRQDHREIGHRKRPERRRVPDLGPDFAPQPIRHAARLARRHALAGVDEEFVGQPSGQRDAQQRLELLRGHSQVDLEFCRAELLAVARLVDEDERSDGLAVAASRICLALANAQHAGQRLEPAARRQLDGLALGHGHFHHEDAVLALLEDESCLGRLETDERHAPSALKPVQRKHQWLFATTPALDRAMPSSPGQQRMIPCATAPNSPPIVSRCWRRLQIETMRRGNDREENSAVTMSAEARALIREAMLLERAGRLSEAEKAYAVLLARWPDLPDSWYNLAVLQRKAHRFDAALASYSQALDRGVSRPEEVHLNRGVIFSDCLRQDDAAEEELNTALAINPNYVPALLNLANLKSDLGRREDTLAIYERVLALDPGCYQALARYAEIKPVSGADDPLIGKLRRALTQPGVTAANRATLGFALGKTLDACCAYDQAFEAYAAANRASREIAGAGALLYDRRRHELYIDQLIAAFPRNRLQLAPRSTAVSPIFICGMFRSRSTLAEQVLAGHSRVTAGGEIDFVPTLVRTELAPFPTRMGQLSPQQLDE